MRLGCEPTQPVVLDTEASFYQRYRWCINAFPTVRELFEHLTKNWTGWMTWRTRHSPDEP